MIHCNLSTIMGSKRLKISDVSRATGVNRGTITRMFNEEATRIELDVVEKICRFLEIEIGELYVLGEETN